MEEEKDKRKTERAKAQEEEVASLHSDSSST